MLATNHPKGNFHRGQLSREKLSGINYLWGRLIVRGQLSAGAIVQETTIRGQFSSGQLSGQHINTRWSKLIRFRNFSKKLISVIFSLVKFQCQKNVTWFYKNTGYDAFAWISSSPIVRTSFMDSLSIYSEICK